MKFNWKIGGEAGFGIMTTGIVLSRIATRSGYNIFNYPEYPSLIRGGHNTLEVVISEDPVTAPKWEVDMLVCLNKVTYDLHKHRLHKDSIVVFDPDEFTIDDPTLIQVSVPFKKIRTQEEINQMMINTVAMGASLSVMGGDLSIFEDLLKEQFSRKGQEVVDYNLKLARIGFDHAEASHIQKIPLLVKKQDVKKQMVLTANDAFSVGTVIADCRFFAAYPMTPASSILMTLAAWQDKTKMVVRHSEDEIAVINSALGASFAGARSAVSTSGGGFALMVEALSYAGVAEIPIVVYLGMRPGPATGMPTWTEQGDLLFAVHAGQTVGHGELCRIWRVLCPPLSEVGTGPRHANHGSGPAAAAEAGKGGGWGGS
jgi:2-oxoglutarate ferredoxin oxidoreductase subunit alpha